MVSNALWPNRIDCSLPGSSVHEFFQARILGRVAIPFSRGIFLTQGLNLGLPHCRQILYHLSHQESSFRDGAMATHSSTLSWKIPGTGEPGGLQSMGSWRVRQDWMTSLSLFTFMHWRGEWQPTPVFLPGESQGWGRLVGCCLWGRTESDMTEAT